MPLTTRDGGVARGQGQVNLTAAPRVGCSDALLGRVIDGFGRGRWTAGGAIRFDESGVGSTPPACRRWTGPTSAADQRPASAAIDGLHTCGLGQRMGIFSGSRRRQKHAAVGDRQAQQCRRFGHRADRRTRPGGAGIFAQQSGARRDGAVRAWWSAPATTRRCCECGRPRWRRPSRNISATRAKHVLLLLDSLTRMCQAQRQIGLAAKEPPATKGFPAQRLRPDPRSAGASRQDHANGSITGFYTVLVEGDDFNEPIPDAVKGITDGHLWLNRALANRGHFPAIDVMQSISRVRGDVIDKDHARLARRVLSLWSTYEQIEDLVNIGAYVAGVNAEYDLAVQSRQKLTEFLQQDPSQPVDLEQARKKLVDLNAWLDSMDRALRAQAAKAKPATK